MKQKSSRRTVLAAALAVAGVFELITSPAFADVHVSQNGATLTVTAPSTLAGKSLVLLWDETGKGDDAVDWANRHSIAGVVSASGSTFTVDLAALGIANGTPCRIATSTRYAVLEKLQMDSTGEYIDTGIADTSVYGIRFGYQSTGASNTSSSSAPRCLASSGTGYFMLSAVNGGYNNFRTFWQGMNQGVPVAISSEAITDVAITNGVITVDGEVKKTNLASGACGTSGSNLFIGKQDNNNYMAYGWWSSVKFYGSDDSLLLDYTPAKRLSDDAVGFWNSVGAGSFVTSSGSGAFTAGDATGETIDTEITMLQSFTPNRALGVEVEESLMTVTVPSGLGGEQLLVMWDDEDKSATGEWAHTNVLESQIADAGGTYAVRLGSIGIKNKMHVCVAAAHGYKTLDKLQMASTQCYVDTGIKDSDVYGIRFGFQGTGASSSGNNKAPRAMGSKDSGSTGYFMLSSLNSGYASMRVFWDSTKTKGSIAVSSSEITDVALTNGVVTVDGAVQNISISNACGETGNSIFVGKQDGADYQIYGWWSCVQFEDKDGNLLLDYMPVQRAGDSAVGFLDRATSTFVASSGTGSFTAGTASETVFYSVNASSTFQVTTIPGLIIIFK